MISAMGSNSIVTVTGLTKPADTTNDQKSWTTGVKIQNLTCYIEQLDAKTTAIFAGDVSVLLFQLISNEVVEIAVGDKITDNHGRSFEVNAVQSFVGDPDIPDHTEVQMVQRYPNN